MSIRKFAFCVTAGPAVLAFLVVLYAAVLICLGILSMAKQVAEDVSDSRIDWRKLGITYVAAAIQVGFIVWLL